MKLFSLLPVALAALWFVVSPVRGADSLATVAVPDDIEVQRDLVYKSAGDQDLTYDLLRARTRSSEPAPLLVFIHGGGWRGGDKAALYRRIMFGVAQPLIRRGLTCAAINYRLAGKNGVTTADSLNDCKDAVRFLAANAAKLNIDTTRIAVMGGSAGGHLTLMTALAPDADYPPADKEHPVGLPRFTAAVPYYPLCHFADPAVLEGATYGNPGRFTPMLGGPLEERAELARKLSPIEYLTRDSPPIFLPHGDDDPVLPVRSSRLFAKKARKLGADLTYLEVKGGNHGFVADGSPGLEEITRRVVAFLAEKLEL